MSSESEPFEYIPGAEDNSKSELNESEEDPSEESRQSSRTTSATVLPTFTPAYRASRTITVPRKRVGLPRRVTFPGSVREEGEPSHRRPATAAPEVVQGVPVGTNPGMTLEEARIMQSMSIDLHTCRGRLDYQSNALQHLFDLHDANTRNNEQVIELIRGVRRATQYEMITAIRRVQRWLAILGALVMLLLGVIMWMLLV